MLIVTGATGLLGRLVVKHLLSHVPAERIGVSVRNAAVAADLARHGIRVRVADYADPHSLLGAFEGAERILLVSGNVSATGGDLLGQHRNVIEAAKTVGAERLLYTSQFSASATSVFLPGREHAATEQMLEDSGLRWTSLRHGYYANSAYMLNRVGFECGKLRGPKDGKVAWTTHEDLAEADALLLAGKVQFDGPTPPLTGNEALDLADLAALAAEILGRPVSREVVTEEAAASALRLVGLPEPTIEILLSYYRAAEAGEFAAVDPTLGQLLGRPTSSMRDFLAGKLREAA